MICFMMDYFSFSKKKFQKYFLISGQNPKDIQISEDIKKREL